MRLKYEPASEPLHNFVKSTECFFAKDDACTQLLTFGELTKLSTFGLQELSEVQEPECKEDQELLESVSKSSFSIPLICTTNRRIPASAGTNQGPEKGDLILL